MPNASPLTVEDRFAIFEQMNLHQQQIDAGWGREQALAYVDLYWPGAKFTVIDLRQQTFEGAEGLKQMYDYAHSVFRSRNGATIWDRSGSRAPATAPPRIGAGW